MNKSHNEEAPRIIISGGGTGGHIFPAVSIANAIKELRPDAEILFVGAEGRMEEIKEHDAQIPMQVEAAVEEGNSEIQTAAEPTAKVLNSDAEFE